MIEIPLQESGLPLSRRRWLGFGTLAALGVNRLSAETRSKPAFPGFGKAKSAIVIFAGGGQSQIDTWDPKPLAPREIRGEFSAISTAVPGTIFCEHMPRIAKLADRFALVRSMSHEDLDHGSACYLALTGHYHKRRSSNPDPTPEDHPAFGAIFKRLRPRCAFAESSIHLNGPLLVPIKISPGQFGGVLGRKHEPMQLGDVSDQKLVLPGLKREPTLTLDRMGLRKNLLESLDQSTGLIDREQKVENLNESYERAFQLLARPETRDAFDLSQESDELRDRYGRNRSGQACLLARRLVEAGVPLTTVFFNQSVRGQDTDPDKSDAYGWDTHNDIFSALREQLLPRFDLAFSALIEDLESRGLLDETLVVCMGEFGRAPKVALEPNFVGNSPGRKHWASVYSVLLAGAGIRPGTVVGASNKYGAYPASRPFAPGDLLATIFSALGIDPRGHVTDPTDRPFPIATGQPIEPLYTG